MKLIAITNVKHGSHADESKRTTPPGAAFDVPADLAEQLIASGAAATPEDYERAKRAARAPDERMAELEAENATLREENAQLRAELTAATEALAKGKK